MAQLSVLNDLYIAEVVSSSCRAPRVLSDTEHDLER